MSGKVILIIVLCLLAIIFMLQNSQSVSVQMLLWAISIPRILLILILLLIGFVMGFVVHDMQARKRRSSE
jgi:uncharacterized integral membrane protein